MFGAAGHRGRANPWRAHGNQSVPAGHDRAAPAADAVSPGLADPDGRLDRLRRALDRRTFDGVEVARHWMIVTFACVFAFCAFGNAWGTRGKHFGWMLLVAVAVLAVAGY